MKLQFSFIKSLAVFLVALGSSAVLAHGHFLTDNEGMTLYTFDKDTKGKSNCYNDCAMKWPPFMAKDGAKVKDGYSIITRNDGTKQWAYNGAPLYTWVGDTKKGDTNGDGVGGVWHIAKKKYKKGSKSY